MMNSNLVPERRTDKNGVTSVRWVKPHQESSGASAFPAPQSAKASHRASKELIEAAATAYIYEIEDDFADDEEYMVEAIEGITDAFSKLPEPVVEEIAKEAGDSSFLKYWGIKLLLQHDERDWDTDFMLDYLKLADTLQDQDFELPEDAIGMVRGVAKGYPGVSLIPMNGDYPEKRAKQLRALVIGTTWVETLVADDDIPENSMTEVSMNGQSAIQLITDDRLSNLLIEHADDIDTIAEFMKTRKSVDVDAIKEVLGNSTPALAEGTL